MQKKRNDVVKERYKKRKRASQGREAVIEAEKERDIKC